MLRRALRVQRGLPARLREGLGDDPLWREVAPSAEKIAALAADIPYVSECHRISGEDCFLVKVHVPRLEDLEVVLDQFLLYGTTTSSFIVSSPVPPRPVFPSAGAV